MGFDSFSNMINHEFSIEKLQSDIVSMSGIPTIHLKDISKLIPDPENKTKFSQKKIEELKDYIIAVGELLADIIVRDLENGTYMIIDGERRYHAISLMSQAEFNTIFPDGIKLKVYPKNTPNAVIKFIQNIANISQRDDLDKGARRLIIIELYHNVESMELSKELKQKLYSNLENEVGLKLDTIKKYVKTEGLIPEFVEQYENDDLSFKDAAMIGSLTPSAQQFIYESKNDSMSDDLISAGKIISDIENDTIKLERVDQDIEYLEKKYEEDVLSQKAFEDSKSNSEYRKNRLAQKVDNSKHKLDNAKEKRDNIAASIEKNSSLLSTFMIEDDNRSISKEKEIKKQICSLSKLIDKIDKNILIVKENEELTNNFYDVVAKINDLKKKI